MKRLKENLCDLGLSINFRDTTGGTSLVIQWLRICLPTQAGNLGSNPGQATKLKSHNQRVPCAVITEPMRSRACVLQQEKHLATREAPALQRRVSAKKKKKDWHFPGSPVVKTQVQSLVRELRFHMPHSTAPRFLKQK